MGCEDRDVSEEDPEVLELEGLGRVSPSEKNGCIQNSPWDTDGQSGALCAEGGTEDPGDNPFTPERPPAVVTQDSCPHISCVRLMVTDDKTGKKTCVCPGLGIFYTILSTFFFSSSALLVKKIEDMHSVQISTYRCIFQMLFVLPGLIYCKTGFLGPKNQRIFLFLRGFLGSGAMILLYYAIQTMPLADATVITFSSPAFTCIFACIFLKEKCTVWDIVFMVFTITGVILIARPPFLFGSNNDGLEKDYSEHLKGTIAAVGSAVCASLTLVVLRKMGKSVHYLLSIWYYAVIGLIECIIALSVIGEWSFPYCGLDRWLLVIIGILGLGGQTFLVKALQIEKAGLVAIMRTMDVVFAFIFQALFLHHTPTWWSIGGALCIVASTAGAAVLKWYTSSKKAKETEL
ncbi:PREDICTED: solute carrier family 35 member G1 [Nanorana parkeri]|uniref:solute carrier family 35 member G1 n=1 Tax=Nanorana parkeri TaxID=125878 RepID=UPI0008541E45|nr:PREDICTED: solute carrier family 35 member G1 [Nanorana parkeri]